MAIKKEVNGLNADEKKELLPSAASLHALAFRPRAEFQSQLERFCFEAHALIDELAAMGERGDPDELARELLSVHARVALAWASAGARNGVRAAGL